ncbi:response regulator [soil metagenome]
MGLTILMIDDDLEDQDLFAETLHSIDSSIQCLSAVNGERALTLLRSLSIHPDYIFLDLNMPIMNGFEFLKEVRKLKQFSTPIYIYTTSSEKKHNDESIMLGASKFITKPSSQSELREILERVFSI